MARIRKLEKGRAAAKELTVSHRDRLVEELRADLELAAEYLNAAADDDDPRVYLSALRTVAEAQGMRKWPKRPECPGRVCIGPFSACGNPRFSTLHAILRAAGLRMAVHRL